MASNSTAYTGLEIFILGPAAKAINTWRLEYDPAYPELEPHITLAYPPFVPLDQWVGVKPAVAACLARFEPFRVVLKQPGVFRSDSSGEPHVLWLKPEDGGHLKRMRRSLERQFPRYVPPMPARYIPHVSIGFFDQTTILEQALARVKAELKPQEFTIHEVVYEVQDERGQQYFDRLPLGKSHR